MEITLIRHTSVNVPKGTCYGASDVPVADTFEQEAAVTKAGLEKFGPFDIVYSSPLTRARKLATYCGYEAHMTDDRLKEMSMGDWEMKRFDEIKDKRLQEWYDDYMHAAPTNGESFPVFYARVASFLDELRRKPYNNVAIFAHGGVLMCAGIYGGLFTKDECFDHLAGYGEIQTMTL